MLNRNVRITIKEACNRIRMSYETRDREARALARETIKHYWKQRHNKLVGVI